MNITRGDYARFNSNTYKEVYEDIEERSLKQYRDESKAHQDTKAELERMKKETIEIHNRHQEDIKALKTQISTMQAEKEEKERRENEEKQRILEKSINKLGWFLTITCVAVPYIIALIGIEIFKAIYTSVSNKTDLTWQKVIYISLAVVVTIILGILYKKLKTWCFKKAKTLKLKKERNLE